MLALSLVCLAAFTIETALGFGATLVTVALGSQLLSIDTILPALVPLNLALSIYLSARYFREVDQRFLFTRLLPFMAIGLPIGIAVYDRVEPSLLKRFFGAFLVLVAGTELWRLRTDAPVRALARGPEIALLLAGGVIHGAFATGGPMAVYVTGRAIEDKGRYRATLSLLWALLNAAMIAGYAWSGDLSPASASLSVALVPAILVGMWAGELAHHRVPERMFRIIVFLMLLASGAMLLVRG